MYPCCLDQPGDLTSCFIEACTASGNAVDLDRADRTRGEESLRSTSGALVGVFRKSAARRSDRAACRRDREAAAPQSGEVRRVSGAITKGVSRRGGGA